MSSTGLHQAVSKAYIKNIFATTVLTFSLTNSFAVAANDDAQAGANVSEGTTTTSISNSDPKFEWTLEKMLMATAMPMSGEEREFLRTHRNLDGIRNWTLADFNSYISTELGKKHVAEESAHWTGVLKMLKKQAAAGSAYMHEAVPTSAKNSLTVNSETVDKVQTELGNTVAAKQIFEQLKSWRQQISILAPFVESMRKKAEASGKSQDFEKAIQDESN